MPTLLSMFSSIQYKKPETLFYVIFDGIFENGGGEGIFMQKNNALCVKFLYAKNNSLSVNFLYTKCQTVCVTILYAKNDALCVTFSDLKFILQYILIPNNKRTYDESNQIDK